MKSSKQYDAIVIGAGISGLVAASELNQRGLKVLVLEHNHQAGGLMSGIWRKDFYFDVGCQSFENMGILFPLLDQYGLTSLFQFHRTRYRLKMPEIDVIVESLKQTREEFKKAYPNLANGFDRVFDMHDKTSSLIQKMFVPELIPFVKDENVKAFIKWFQKTIPYTPWLKTLMFDDFEDWYKKVLPASGVRDLLSTCGYSRMNVFVASAFWHLWAEDYWYPEKGFQHMFDVWVDELQKRGVEFSFKNTVIGLEKETGAMTGKKATAVLTKKDERYEAGQFVYCGDYKKGVYELIGAENFSNSELSKLEKTKHSDALVSVYLGLNFPREKLKEIVKSAHIFYFPTYECRTEMDLNDPKAHAKTFLEVTAHCINDSSLAPEGKSSLVLQAFSQSAWLENWNRETDNPFAYKDLKKKVADDIISSFEKIFPDVRKYIEYMDVGSPHTAIRFTRNELGGTCGFELNWKNFPFWNPLSHSKTPLNNFHMAGHFTVWPGAVPTAALSGKIAALRAAQLFTKKLKQKATHLPHNNTDALKL